MSVAASGSDCARLEAGTFRLRDHVTHERCFIPPRLDAAPIKGPLAEFPDIKWHPRDREHDREPEEERLHINRKSRTV
jgi:hypothetical protein